MIKNILLPISCVLIAATIVYWIAETSGFGVFQAISIAILVFCALLTLYSYLQTNLRNNRTLGHMQQLADLEKEFEVRISKLENNFRDNHATGDFEERLNALENIDYSNSNRTTQPQNQQKDTLVKPVIAIDAEEASFDTASNPNVIPLGSATRRKQMEERRAAVKDEEALPAGLNLEEHFHLFLYPIFEIPDREVSAISAIAGLYDQNNSATKTRHIFRQNGLTLSARTSKTIVIKSVQAVALAMREMKKNKEQVPIILDITAALVGSAATWDIVRNLLEKDDIFQDMFIAQINMKDFLSFSKSQNERFASLREIGIDLCIGNCAGYRGTIKLLETGQFQYITISAGELMRYNSDRKDQLSDVLIDLANDHKIQVITTGVERESHIVAMLDYEVSHAQGPILSEPILSNMQLNSLEPLSKDA